MCHPRLACIVVLAAVLACSWTESASAEVTVSNLRLGTDPMVAVARSIVPIGTRTVYARYDFREAVGNRVTLDVSAYGGVVVSSASERLSASGNRTVAFTGDSMLRQLAAELLATAQSTRGSARDAATREFGTQEYLGVVQAGVVRLGNVRTIMTSVRTPAVSSSDMEALEVLEAQVSDLVSRALRAATDEQRRQLAGRMDEPLAEAVGMASRLVRAVADVRDVGLPVSGEAWQYVVLLSVDGSPADSVEFMVDGSSLWLPTTSRHAPVIR